MLNILKKIGAFIVFHPFWSIFFATIISGILGNAFELAFFNTIAIVGSLFLIILGYVAIFYGIRNSWEEDSKAIAIVASVFALATIVFIMYAVFTNFFFLW